MKEEDVNILPARLDATGMAVLKVTPGSAAAAAGLQGVRTGPDGTITSVTSRRRGRPIGGERAALLRRLDDYQAGDSVRLTVLRGGAKR